MCLSDGGLMTLSLGKVDVPQNARTIRQLHSGRDMQWQLECSPYVYYTASLFAVQHRMIASASGLAAADACLSGCRKLRADGQLVELDALQGALAACSV